MAYDVSNFLNYMHRRAGALGPDRVFRLWVIVFGAMLFWPLRYVSTMSYFRSLLSLRYEMYAVRDGVYYKHFKHGMKNAKAGYWRNKLWI